MGNSYHDEWSKKVLIDALPTSICNRVRMLRGSELGAHSKGLAQDAATLLDQQHRKTEEPRKPQRRARVYEHRRRRALMATVGYVENHEKQCSSKSVAHKRFATDKNFKTLIGGQGQSKYCRFCISTDQNLNQCRFAYTELAIIERQTTEFGRAPGDGSVVKRMDAPTTA